MTTDTVMMAMILGGFVLCGCYFRAQYVDWRHEKNAQIKNAVLLRQLYRNESSPREKAVPVVVDPKPLVGKSTTRSCVVWNTPWTGRLRSSTGTARRV
jgi:hypothetical protein